MKTHKLQQYLSPGLVAAVALGWSAGAFALPVVNVSRTGAFNIYKGSCAYSATTLTITASPAPTSQIEVYIYLGGSGNGNCVSCQAVSPNNCNSFAGDFNVSGTGVSLISPVPNLYEVVIPAGHTSAAITLTALTNASPCGEPYQSILVAIPATSDYTQNEYTVASGAQNPTALAQVWETAYAPNVTINVSANSNPPYLYKEYQTSLSFTLTASQAFPAQKSVYFYIGGDGTDDNEGDPCFATYPTDFTVTGASTIPINNGFVIVFNEGNTSKTFTVTAVNNSINCEVLGFQPLYVTIPSFGSCYGYGPGSTPQAVGRIYPGP